MTPAPRRLVVGLMQELEQTCTVGVETVLLIEVVAVAVAVGQEEDIEVGQAVLVW